MILPHENLKTNGDSSSSPLNTAAPRALNDMFRKFSQKSSAVVGSPWAFMVATLIIVAWALLGHHYHYSDTWQLIINTGTTIVTFLMVFLIQNTQNRDARAIHLKLDELIRGLKGARNRLVDLENCTEEELEQIEREFHRVRKKADRGHVSKEAGREAANAQKTVEAIADAPHRV
jgi:low affinity Fe/Cu permease